MDEAILVHHFDSGVDLPEYVEFVLEREVASGDVLGEVVGQVLHDQEVLLLVLECLDEVDDGVVATELVLDLDLVVQELLVVVSRLDLLHGHLLELSLQSTAPQEHSPESPLTQSPHYLPLEYLLQLSPRVIAAYILLLLLLLEETLDPLVLGVSYEALCAGVGDLLQYTLLTVYLGSAPSLPTPLLFRPVYHFHLLLLFLGFAPCLLDILVLKWLLILEEGSMVDEKWLLVE